MNHPKNTFFFWFIQNISTLQYSPFQSLKNMKEGGVKEDKKGLDSVMEELYDKHVASKDLDDWENIRTPRAEEPETLDANQAKRAAILNRRSEKEAKAFTTEDYGKIEESDISFDFGLDNDKDNVGRSGIQTSSKGVQYRYKRVGGVPLNQ